MHVSDCFERHLSQLSESLERLAALNSGGAQEGQIRAEATSALDSESEGLVLSALAVLKGRQTIILVAHRLATTQIADVVFVLQEGRIVQSGPFDVLMRDLEGPFAAIAVSQGLMVPTG